MTTTESATSEETPDPNASDAGSEAGNTNTFRLVAVAILVVVVALVAWLLIRDSSSSSDGAKGVTASEIATLATAANHPVYWLGTQSGFTNEWRQKSDGTIVIRYLPAGANVGTSDVHPAVATYPFPGAYAALVRVSKEAGESGTNIAGGGIAVPTKGNPGSIHVAYPGIDYQIEVFDPTPGVAKRAVLAGRLLDASNPNAAPPATTTTEDASSVKEASAAELEALPASVDHVVYWAGPRGNSIYELRQDADGSIVIRYLPTDAKVGATTRHLTVATYPFAKAIAALKATVKADTSLTVIPLKGGGLAVIDPKAPTNAHAAFPGEDFQIEVYSPSAAQTSGLLKAGKIVPLG